MKSIFTKKQNTVAIIIFQIFSYFKIEFCY